MTFPLYIEMGKICNLTRPASPLHYQHDLMQAKLVSGYGAINMPKAVARVCAPACHVSTSEVYGNPEARPQQEAACSKAATIFERLLLS